ncbi:MAG: 23S rRNA (uracil(1939)-C(5))-methyltransferase RlmD [Oscillospiraceae bacterium]|nr:23S rRNA (uracil(1939)-C(5))-methyltransferase RlmD [Oscillospiraceae bacterium]
MKKGNIHTVEITAYTSEGAGIARIDGMAVFVPLALRGEVCEIMILKVEKSFAYAKLIRVIEPSPERRESACEYYPKCGGCTMWHMSYEEELRVKEEHVRSCIERISKVDAPVLPIIGADGVKRYRNKAQFPVGKDATSGFYRPRSHDIVPSESCLIQSEVADKIRAAVHEWQKMCNISSYDEKSGKGVLRHIYVRNGKGGALLCLVVTEKPENADKLIEIITEKCPEVCGIVLNINKEKTNVILGNKYITLWGASALSDELCGSAFSISPAAFYQVNHAQTERLYDIATSLALSNGAKTALDLYCGIGTITLKLAKSMERVIGVEVVPQAIEDAKKNAELNGIGNAEFICADAGEAAQRLTSRGEKPDAIVVDPPRKGLSPEVITEIKRMSPENVVYVSCDPATLARDLKIFEEDKSYKVISVQPVDMFPRTKHCECIVQLRCNEHSSI